MRKGKKIAVALLTVALGMACLTGCGASEEKGSSSAGTSSTSTKETEKKEDTIDISGVTLLNKGTLTVGEEVGYPPFEDFAEDGTTPEGYDVDIISEVAKRLGLKVNIINTAWDGIFAGIDKNYDCVCSAVTITPKRKKTMIFTTPYIKNYQSIVVRPGDEKKYKNFKALNGKTVAVQKETTSDELISDYKSTGTIKVEIVANEKVTSCFTQLANKEIDAVVVDSTVADGYVPKHSDKCAIAYTDKKEAEEFGIAVGKKNTALQKAINEALDGMEKEGFIKDTYDYWFGGSK